MFLFFCSFYFSFSSSSLFLIGEVGAGVGRATKLIDTLDYIVILAVYVGYGLVISRFPIHSCLSHLSNHIQYHSSMTFVYFVGITFSPVFFLSAEKIHTDKLCAHLSCCCFCFAFLCVFPA